jgi:hypothetical protein
MIENCPICDDKCTFFFKLKEKKTGEVSIAAIVSFIEMSHIAHLYIYFPYGIDFQIEHYRSDLDRDMFIIKDLKVHTHTKEYIQHGDYILAKEVGTKLEIEQVIQSFPWKKEEDQEINEYEVVK